MTAAFIVYLVVVVLGGALIGTKTVGGSWGRMFGIYFVWWLVCTAIYNVWK